MANYAHNPRAQQRQDRFEVPVLIAAILVIPVVLIEEQVASGTWLTVAVVANWAIWLMFLAEYVAVASVADDRWGYTKSAWLDIVIIVASFPGLFALARLARLARITRVLRILRLVRLAGVMSRGATALRRIFGRAGLAYAAGLTVLIALGFGTVVALAEDSIDTPLDGIWWAFVTLTTVGYGDISPESPLGRALAIILMMIGIGLVAAITASVAARFVEEDEASLDKEVARLHARLDAIEAALGVSTVPDHDG